MTSPQPAAATTDAVADYVARRTGLSTAGSRGTEIRRAIDTAVARSGARTREQYRDLLERGGTEFDHLAAALTITESYFFRHLPQVQLLRERILPERAAAVAPGETLHLWSAACARGEEPYTLAILLVEAGLSARAHVLATDLSRAAVALAEAGVFQKWSLRAVAPDDRPQYFTETPAGFRIHPRFAQVVSFRQHNLLDPLTDAPSPMDVILCRNVLIYLTPAAVDQVAQRLTAALAPGGWLLTAPADPPLDVDGLDVLMTPAGVAYRRATSDGRGHGLGADVRILKGHPRPRTTDMNGARPPRVDAAPPSPSVPASPAASSERRVPPPSDEPPVPQLATAPEGADAGVETTGAAVAAAPTDAQVRALHALALLEAGDAERCVAAARAAIYLEPELAIAHLVLAQAEILRGNTAAARRGLRNAVKLLEAMPVDAAVALADGEPAGRLAVMAATQERALATVDAPTREQRR